MKKWILITITILLSNFVKAEIEFDTNYVGGNGILGKIDGTKIYLHQDHRDTHEWWFYWNFELSNISGKEITVEFTKGDVLAMKGPAYSIDKGKTWKWLGENSIKRQNDKMRVSFKHKIPKDINSIRYCITFPYYLEDFQKFVDKFNNETSSMFEIVKLAKTKEGRNIYLKFGNKNAKTKIILTARHHCCESTASYLLEGIIDRALSDSKTGNYLRENAEFIIVPFVDLDGVQAGDQGKNRFPHDHNRDYIENPIYPSVAEIMNILSNLEPDSKKILIDFHCPGIRERKAYFYHTDKGDINNNIIRFSTILERNALLNSNGLIYYKRDDAIFGKKKWNSTIRPMFKDWARTLPNAEISTTFEFPYADTKGIPVTDKSAKDFGGTFADSLSEYILTR